MSALCFIVYYCCAGSDHIGIQLTPLNGWHLSKWSFMNARFDSLETTFLYLACGRSSASAGDANGAALTCSWSFWLVVEVDTVAVKVCGALDQ